MIQNLVPKNLKTWFIIHFYVDIIIAIPLLISPQFFLELLGWHSIDPFTTRIVAAALFGIGLESFLGRNSSADVYMNMLRLKLIWSGAAVVGIALSIFQSSYLSTLSEWLLLITFIVFHILWQYWRYQIKKLLT